jgi:hypothetical protein
VSGPVGHHGETSLNKTKKEAAGLGIPAKKKDAGKAEIFVSWSIEEGNEAGPVSSWSSG